MVYLMPLCAALLLRLCAVAFCGVRYLDGVPYALVCRFAFAVLRSLVWREVPG